MTEQQMPAWEEAAQQICEAVETATDKTVRKVCDDIYESVMETVQNYLKENVAFNLASTLAAYEREAVSLRKENARCADIAERMAGALERSRVDLQAAKIVIESYKNASAYGIIQTLEIVDAALSAFMSATQDTEVGR